MKYKNARPQHDVLRLTQKDLESLKLLFYERLCDLVTEFDFEMAHKIMAEYNMGWAVMAMPDYYEPNEDYYPIPDDRDPERLPSLGIPKPHAIAHAAKEHFERLFKEMMSREFQHFDKDGCTNNRSSCGRFDYEIYLYHLREEDGPEFDLDLNIKFVPIEYNAGY